MLPSLTKDSFSSLLRCASSGITASSFKHPYLNHTAVSRARAFEEIGIKTIDELFEDIPAEYRVKDDLKLGAPMKEADVVAHMTSLSEQNLTASKSKGFFLGAGAYRHYFPLNLAHIFSRTEFLTAYTPYQPEVSQGTLQGLFEYQTYIKRITGLDVANASLYDGATATAEAALMACRCTRRKEILFARSNLHPHYAEVVETYAKHNPSAITIIGEQGHVDGKKTLRSLCDEVKVRGKKVAAVLVQTPDILGNVHDFRALAECCHKNKSLLIVTVPELASLGLVVSPGDLGADICVGDATSLASGLAFGGATVGFISCRKKYMRQMPGRYIGQTVDADGKRAFCITLATREQHIRREKATSNICTASSLLANTFSAHMATLGELGFRELSERCHEKAMLLRECIVAECPQCEILTGKEFFSELCVRLPEGVDAASFVDRMAKEKDILIGVPCSRLFGKESLAASDLDERCMLMCTSELTTEEEIAAVVKELSEL
eukprot:gnl/Carplike_NY0171/1884_a2554_808.p1 GENE.gnl/Carplike_NY0171/1884_a2554_808~~gnl/Carplike_NY0171/1884_a2554_808.p1  ORF type:complete len:494 (+),score=167.89 gnl/Carplike_NY0171/1884_a2554_808:16-1497(+)